MKTFQFLLGLAILAVVLWTGASPINVDAKTVVGGWWTPADCTCSGTHTEACTNGPDPDNCNPGLSTLVCTIGSGGACTTLGYDDCDYGGFSCPGQESACM